MTRRTTLLFGTALILIASAPALAGDDDWINTPARTYDVQALSVDDVAGTLTVDVKPAGPVSVDVNGIKWKVDRTQVRQNGKTLVVSGTGRDKVWDWHNWFNFRQRGKNDAKRLYVHVIVPKGMPVRISDLAGNAVVGSTEGPVKLETVGYTESKVGNVANLDVSVAGAGKIVAGNVAGRLSAETAGSGDIRVGDVCDVKAEIAGSGSMTVGKARCKLSIEIAGSGNFTVGAVNGPTHVEIAGSGSVNIADGTADPLHVEIMGAGDVSFGGLAVNPHIESMGSGNVRLKAYRGNLHKEGNANLKVGP